MYAKHLALCPTKQTIKNISYNYPVTSQSSSSSYSNGDYYNLMVRPIYMNNSYIFITAVTNYSKCSS